MKKGLNYLIFFVSLILQAKKRYHCLSSIFVLLSLICVCNTTMLSQERNKGVTVEAQSHKRRVTGRVTDAKGESLVGVSVNEEGTKNGTITDIDGLYTLNVSNNARLKFTYIGYEPQELKVGSVNVYDVILSEKVNELNETVVVGYGQQRKISSIGSQSSIKIGDIKTPTASLSTVLAGRLSGVVAVQRTGEPGKDAADIWIRGLSSPNNDRPLILVDGIERPFNDIDPQDVESITVLKDASATAVYGVRGANGVILIKTKPGILGKPTVNVDYYEGFNQFTKTPSLADGITYMNAANEALTNSGYSPRYTQQYIENTRKGVDKLLYPNVNWMKEVFNDWGRTRRVNANIRGGSPMAQFYVSLSYYNETGNIKTSNYEKYDSKIKYTRYNFLTNLSLQVTPSTKVEVGAQGFLGDGNYPDQSSQTIFGSSFINPVIYPVMFVVNGVQYVPGVHTQGADRNPYADATKRGYRKVMNSRLQSNIRITQNLDMLTKGLKATALFAYDISNTREQSYYKNENTYYFLNRNDPYDSMGHPILTSIWNQGSNVLSFWGGGMSGDRTDNLEVSLTYDRAFGPHRIGGMTIYTQQNRIQTDAGDIISSIPYRLQGVAGRMTYSFQDKYLAEFNVGYNGSENFPPNRRFGTFPAVGVGWVPSGEKFWKPIEKIIPFLKIRYTNGYVGNGSVGNRRFMYLEQYTYDGSYGFAFGDNIGMSGIRIQNPATSLGWELAHKQDLGFDIRMLNNDLNLVLDFFKENRTAILLDRSNSLADFAGFQVTPYGNVGKTKTNGWDANVEYNKKFGKDWNLTVRGNFTYANPVWVDNDIPANPYPWRNQKGYSLTSIEGFTAKGLYTQADIDIIKAWLALPADMKAKVPQPFPTPYNVSLSDLKAGDIMYVDKNKDGKIDNNDISWLGNGDVPKINYGFGYDVGYKAVSVGMLFQGTAQAVRFVGGIVKPFNDAGSGNVYSNINDRWSINNPNQCAFYPRLAYGSASVDNMNNTLNSTWWLKDMSFLRLKVLQINYNIPQKLCNKLLISNASIYMTGMNLLTFSRWKLWDPELNTGDGTLYPNLRTYSLGINFSF